MRAQAAALGVQQEHLRRQQALFGERIASAKEQVGMGVPSSSPCTLRPPGDGCTSFLLVTVWACRPAMRFGPRSGSTRRRPRSPWWWSSSAARRPSRRTTPPTRRCSPRTTPRRGSHRLAVPTSTESVIAPAAWARAVCCEEGGGRMLVGQQHPGTRMSIAALLRHAFQLFGFHLQSQTLNLNPQPCSGAQAAQLP